jgi:hypothetical protein
MSGDLSGLFGGAVFDPSAVEPQEDFKVLPAGKYKVLVEESEIKGTKAGTGKYLKLKLKVLDGEAKGRVMFDQVNIDNPNQQCVEIGWRCLSALCRAVGITALSDSAQLVNKVALACVKVKGDQNEVRTYEPAGGSDVHIEPPSKAQMRPSQESQPPAPTAPAHVVSGVKLPWAR